MTTRASLFMLATLAGLVLSIGCTNPSAVSRLDRVPEGRLAPPGAQSRGKQIDNGSIGSEPSVLRIYEWAGHDFDAVRSYYAEQFETRGWLPSNRGGDAVWSSQKYSIRIYETTLDGTDFAVQISEVRDGD